VKGEFMKKKSWILASLITLIISAVAYYVVLPPLNVFAQEFWISMTFVAVIFLVSFLIFNNMGKGKSKTVGKISLKGAGKSTVVLVIIAAAPLVVLLIGNIISSTFFNATQYSQIITVQEAVFEDDMPETNLVTNIPLMDSESAHIIGERKLGSLSEVVSQYRVNGTYSQINYRQVPKKVSILEYDDFFKWLNNKDKGILGYVMVDPVAIDAEYVTFRTPVKYADSAFFNEDLNRALRFSYPTKIFGNCVFEIDEEGNPHYIVACMSPKVGLFGAMDVNEVIIFNPCDGTSQLYGVSDTPSWVDNVFSGFLASQKYDWYGTLKNGFLNSVIGNKDCKVTTDDFGYIILGDDVWFFTGVTSVSSDESNIGFIISNARTGEYKFYSVIGAEEYSAMGAAQGEVQEKGYVASFPSLINVSGEATYIMVLKDANGIVKLYALVNVENYSIVATGDTQTKAKEAYIALLKEEGIVNNDVPDVPPETQKAASITVNDVRIVTVANQSVVYLTGNDGNLYKQTLDADESMMLIRAGDVLSIQYHDTQIAQIRQILSWTVASPEAVS
jgi:hypothetical protein